MSYTQLKPNPNHNTLSHYKWGLIGISALLWCFVISGIILRYSSSSDFNYTKGKLVEVKRFEYDVKGRLGGKIGTAHKVKFALSNSEIIFYIDNNFSSQHHQYIRQIESSKTLEVWSDGDLLDGKEQRVYKLKGDGITFIAFDSTKDVYVEKSQLTLYLAIFSSLFSLLVIRPNWFLRIIINQNKEDESLVEFYLKKFETRKSEELENIINNKSDFHPDAVLAAKQTLKQR